MWFGNGKVRYLKSAVIAGPGGRVVFRYSARLGLKRATMLKDQAVVLLQRPSEAPAKSRIEPRSSVAIVSKQLFEIVNLQRGKRRTRDALRAYHAAEIAKIVEAYKAWLESEGKNN